MSKPSRLSTMHRAISSAASSKAVWSVCSAAIVKLPKAFRGKAVAFRPTANDGVFNAFFRTK